MNDGHELGRAGERLAEQHLRRHGYVILARNFRCRDGEIDLVACENGEDPEASDATIVFVEVKTRRGTAFGAPLEAVDARKRRRLSRAAQHFLLCRGAGHCAIRFDVVGVLWRGDGPQVEHVPDAFGID